MFCSDVTKFQIGKKRKRKSNLEMTFLVVAIAVANAIENSVYSVSTIVILRFQENQKI